MASSLEECGTQCFDSYSSASSPSCTLFVYCPNANGCPVHVNTTRLAYTPAPENATGSLLVRRCTHSACRAAARIPDGNVHLGLMIAA